MHIDRRGFTIVELMIVIVVIAILAAVILVAYNGIQSNARISSVKSATSQVAKRVAAHRAENGAYPATLAAVGIQNSASTTFQYRNYGNDVCVSAAESGVVFQSVNGQAPSYGDCVNLAVAVYQGGATSDLTYSGQPVATGTLSPSARWWAAAGPIQGSLVDNFVAVLTGYITPPVTGIYTITTLVDDRDLFYINDALILDGSLNGSTVPTSGTVSLQAGTPVPFRWVIRENTGGAGIQSFTWSYPGQSTTNVPNSAINTQP